MHHRTPDGGASAETGSAGAPLMMVVLPTNEGLAIARFAVEMVSAE
ncbi:hypothetical protein [Promicromonospora sp. NPDC023805]